MADRGFVGLGFHPTESAGGETDSVPGGDGCDGVVCSSAADALLRQYMGQCLDYHRQQHADRHVGQQQQQHRLQYQQNVQQTSASVAILPPSRSPLHPPSQRGQTETQQQQQQQQQSSLPMFVSGPQIASSYVPPPNSATLSNSGGQQWSSQQPSQRAVPLIPQQRRHHADDAQKQEHKQAIDDALAFAMRVVPSAGIGTNTPNPPLNAPPLPQTISVPGRPPSGYAERRAAHAHLFRKHLRSALLRNLEYVARRDEEDMKRHQEELERHLVRSRNLKVRHQQSFEVRREAVGAARSKDGAVGARGEASKLATSKSGVGTTSRKRIEHKKKEEGHAVTADTERKRELQCAVYITGLPMDGTFTEEGLRTLFGSYGALKRAVTYKDKRTGMPKGDGLVVYERPKERGGTASRKDMEEFVGNICVQLNGAELPCGSRICVEPANPDYNSKKHPTTSTSIGQNRKNSTVAADDDVGHYGPAAFTATNGSITAASSAPPPCEGTQFSFEDAPVEVLVSAGSAPDEAEKSGADAGNRGADDLDDFFASLT